MFLGNQTPTFQNFSEDCFEYEKQVLSDDQIEDILGLFGLKLLSWQMMLVKKLLIAGDDPNGSKLLLNTLVLLVPRQNGKSEILIAYIIISLFMGRSGIYSSFIFTSAKEIWKRIKTIIQKNEIVSREFAFSSDESKTPKVEYIGSKKKEKPYFVFVTRSGEFGRGNTDLDILIYDEAQHIQESQIAGIEATVSTSSAPQHIYMGTPALPIVDSKTGKVAANNDYFNTLKKSILAQNSIKKVWIEWSAEQVFERGIPEIIAKYNPSFNHDLGGGKRITIDSFDSNTTNLNFSIERLGYQVASSIYGDKNLFTPEIIPSICLSNEELEKKYYRKGKYTLSIKSTLNGKNVYLVKTMRSKDSKTYFTAIVDILKSSDHNTNEKLVDIILKELKTLQCSKIIIDGNIRNNIRNGLVQVNKWSSKKNQNSQGKISFCMVSEVVESTAVFTEKFNAGNIHFSENLQSTLEDLMPSIQRRPLREGYGYISGTMDAELVDAFALGVLEASKNL